MEPINILTLDFILNSSYSVFFILTVASFCSELNDTVVEAQLRITQIRPVLPIEYAVNNFLKCSNRLLILVLYSLPFLYFFLLS